MKQKLKMYILVKEAVGDKPYGVGHAINSAAHAGAMIDHRGWPKDDPIMAEWYRDSFRKVTCKVSEEEFERAKQFEDWFHVEEMAFDGQEVVLVFKPRHEWPKFFNYLRMYK